MIFIPVLLCGGAGTRLWPLSRKSRPKPFITLPDGQSLLQKAFMRAARLPGVTEIVTVTNRDYYFQVSDECRASQIAQETSYLLEPVGRSTAPAIALAALYAMDRFGEAACLLILPADHLISKEMAFCDSVAAARDLADQDFLVTFGIRPEAAETGFGYVESGEPIGRLGRRVRRFIEKPDSASAERYLDSADFYWNSGMFCFRSGALIAAMQKTCPDLLSATQACWAETNHDRAPIEFPEEAFMAQPTISIDYAVMERADNVAVVPCDLGWSDIGTWSALAKLTPADDQGNRSLGETVLINSKNTFIQSSHHLVAAIGVNDLVIVDTPDATLVAHKDGVQEIRKIVEKLENSAHETHRVHRTVYRPWGTYTVLENYPGYKIKRIEVQPGASISLQMHRYRSEHWVVVSGTATILNDDLETVLNPNESTYISPGHKHRLSNHGKDLLVIIEVQIGTYLEEDDIVRFDDQYNRT
jgi:mannose-1-phosphate guanylyltransferase